MERIANLRRLTGMPARSSEAKVRDHMIAFVQEFVRRSPFVVLATSNAEGDCDASPKGGKPGFVKIIDERTLLIPDVGGNRLYQSTANLVTNPKAALLFLIPGQDMTVRVNGRVRFVEIDDLERLGLEPELHDTDANSAFTQGFILSVDEAYHQCPRSLRFAALWDTQAIAANRTLRVKTVR